MTVFPAAIYKIILRDPITGIQVAEFTDFRSLTYERLLNDVGTYSILLGEGDEVIQYFLLDAHVDIYRSVPAYSMDWYKAFSCLHVSTEKNHTEDGDATFRSSGVGLNDLLARRVIGYVEGTNRADKNGPTDDVMSAYVAENCGPNAGIVNGRMVDGNMPGFLVSSTNGLGVAWAGSHSYENLLDVLKDLANFAKIDFAVNDIEPNHFMFTVYPAQYGVDRTTVGLSGGLNGSGNVPVVFSINDGTVSDIKFTEDHAGEANVVYVLGPGTLSTRKIFPRIRDSAVALSPYNQREIARGAGQQEYKAEFDALGDEVLNEKQYKKQVEFDPLQQPSTIYGRDFDLGDRVTVLEDDEPYHKKIIGIKGVVEFGKGEQLTVTFSDLT